VGKGLEREGVGGGQSQGIFQVPRKHVRYKSYIWGRHTVNLHQNHSVDISTDGKRRRKNTDPGGR